MMLRTNARGAASAPALARPARQTLPLVGAGLSLFALLWVQLSGPWAGDTIPWAVGVVAVVLLGIAVLRRAIQAMRQGDGMVLAVSLLAVIFSLALYGSTVAIGGGQLAFSFWTTLSGGALCFSCVQRLRRRAVEGVTPWQAMAGGAGAMEERNRALVQLSGALLGATLLLAGLTVGVSWLADVASQYIGAFSTRGLLLMMLAVLGLGGGLALALVILRLVASLGADGNGVSFMRQSPHPDASAASRYSEPHDEPVVAAHLHDSVLQTLALIGRSADDPARVKQLALQQERSLRDWLAGRDSTKATSLAGAIRVAAQEVEDEEPGARIEVVAVGDAPLDRLSDALVRAAREAMRNAVRHAGSPVRVFVEVEGTVREVFVRDTGAGFDLAQIAEERRGVRDAIIGRMEHVGGSATIESGADGTEIALRGEAPA